MLTGSSVECVCDTGHNAQVLVKVSSDQALVKDATSLGRTGVSIDG